MVTTQSVAIVAVMELSASQLTETCRELQRNLYIVFMGLSKAFECVDEKLLWSVLQTCDYRSRFRKLVKELY